MSDLKQEFENWAISHGGLSLIPANGGECGNGWFPATYAHSMTEIAWRAFANRRTQPKATAPAQDLQLVVATSTETGFFHVVINLNDGRRTLVLYDKQHSLNGDTVGVADIPLTALASSANALSAGDGEPMTMVKKDGQPYAAYPRRKQAEVYATGLSSGADVQIIDGVFIAAILQSQKGGSDGKP